MSPQDCKIVSDRGRGRPAAQHREVLWAVPTLQHWFTSSGIVKIRNPRIAELHPAIWIFKCIWDLNGRREVHLALRYHCLARWSFKPQNSLKIWIPVTGSIWQTSSDYCCGRKMLAGGLSRCWVAGILAFVDSSMGAGKKDTPGVQMSPATAAWFF